MNFINGRFLGQNLCLRFKDIVVNLILLILDSFCAAAVLIVQRDLETTIFGLTSAQLLSVKKQIAFVFERQSILKYLQDTCLLMKFFVFKSAFQTQGQKSQASQLLGRLRDILNPYCFIINLIRNLSRSL